MKEIWKDIQNYEGLYKISNMGRVKSLSRQAGTVFRKERILKIFIGTGGYNFIRLCKNSKYKNLMIHRLVAKEFLENPNNYPQINHIDGDKLNNLIENLEWCTSSYNLKHAYKIGTKTPVHIGQKGEKNSQAKLTRQKVLEIKEFLKKKILQKDIAQWYNISQQQISRINLEHNWKGD